MASGDFALYLVRDDHKHGAVYNMYLNYTAPAKASVIVKVNNIVNFRLLQTVNMTRLQ